MRKLSKKSGLLFASVVMVCAFVLPSVASAGSFHPVGTHHVLDSGNLAFSVGAPIGGGSICASSAFTARVNSLSDISISAASFTRCHGTGSTVNCTVTPSATNLPWTATPTATDNVQIHNIHVDVVFENTPGAASPCALPGTVTLTGTLGGGTFSNPSHHITLANETGLHAVIPTLGDFPATVTGTIRDTQQTLIMTD